MSRVLHAPALDATPQAMASPSLALDPVARAAVEQAAAEAHARGRREGAAEAQHAAADALARATAALRPALDALREELSRLRDARVDADATLALAIAEAILGREPAPDAPALAVHLAAVLAQVDDPSPVIHVHPDDRATVAELLAAGGDRAEVVSDSALAPGEARIVGSFARATISRPAALAAVRDALLGADADDASGNETVDG